MQTDDRSLKAHAERYAGKLWRRRGVVSPQELAHALEQFGKAVRDECVQFISKVADVAHEDGDPEAASGIRYLARALRDGAEAANYDAN